MHTTLAEVTERVPNARPEDERDREFAYIDISAICNETFRIVACKRITGAEAPSRARRPVQTGDVLFSNVRTYLRNVALVTDEVDADLCSTGFTVLRPNGAVDPRYLFRYVLSDDLIEAVTPQQTGTHYPATSDAVVLSQSIPLPPLAEQRRIVEKVEALLAGVNASRDRLQRAAAILKRFRQAVLAAACSGRLTADWRDSNPGVAPAGEALATHLDQLRKWMQSGRRSSDIGEPDADTPDDLPDSWAWAAIGQVVALEENSLTDGPFGSNLKTSHYTDEGPRVIRLQNIGDGMFVDHRAHISPEHFLLLRKHAINGGDIAIAALGDRPPRACIIPPGLGHAIVKADCIRFRPSETVCLPGYANCVLNDEATRRRTAAVVHGVGRPRMNLQQVRIIALPLPPLVEQQEIVRRVDALFALADAIEQRVAAAGARAERLTQAILAKAFRGELVPQAPNDEPASVLLERIRREREAHAGTPSRAPARRGTRRRAA